MTDQTKKPAKVETLNVDQLKIKATSALNAEIDSICKALADSTLKLHVIAVKALRHFSQHGDTGPLVRLQNGLPKSIRKLALAQWAAKYSPIVWGKKDAKDNCDGATKAKPGSKGDKPFDIDGADANPFYDVPEAEKPKGLVDLVKLLTQQITASGKLLADPSIPRKGNISDDEIRADIADKQATLDFVQRRKGGNIAA